MIILMSRRKKPRLSHLSVNEQGMLVEVVDFGDGEIITYVFNAIAEEVYDYFHKRTQIFFTYREEYKNPYLGW